MADAGKAGPSGALATTDTDFAYPRTIELSIVAELVAGNAGVLAVSNTPAEFAPELPTIVSWRAVKVPNAMFGSRRIPNSGADPGTVLISESPIVGPPVPASTPTLAVIASRTTLGVAAAPSGAMPT